MKNGKLDPERITKNIDQAVCVRYYESVDSTNAEARRQISEGLSGPALFLSEEQTAGRGRLGRSFYSPKETGIYMTLACPVHAAYQDAVRITSKAAAAVLQGIQSVVNAALSIKWVNDIYIGERKIAGILVEAVQDAAQTCVEWLVIGVGINVSTSDFPEELKETAGALTHGSCDRTSLVTAVTERLLWEAEHLQDDSFLKICREKSAVLGKEILYGSMPDLKAGKAVAIDDDGALIVEKADGSTEILNSGEISIRFRKK